MELNSRYLRHIKNKLPLRLFLKLQYRTRTGYPLNLEHPERISEKISWLKIYYKKKYPDEKPIKNLIDKYEVRNHIKLTVGESLLNEVYGIYEHVEQINFDGLPDQFVLKGTHGSGMILICQNKSQFNWNEALEYMNMWLHKNWYYNGREWGYKSIKPRILVEKYIQSSQGLTPSDYKIYCFNGQPRLIQHDVDRFVKARRNWYDHEWNSLPIIGQLPKSEDFIPPPANLNEMLEIAKTLSRDFPFLRVDLYSVNCKVIFGELTFYPNNGTELFNPVHYEHIIGEYLSLPNDITV